MKLRFTQCTSAMGHCTRNLLSQVSRPLAEQLDLIPTLCPRNRRRGAKFHAKPSHTCLCQLLVEMVHDSFPVVRFTPCFYVPEFEAMERRLVVG